MMNWKAFGKIDTGQIEVPSQQSSGGSEENHGDLRIAGVLPEIRTEHLQNTSRELYRYAKPFVS
jgi:hypothetical protein